MVILLPRLDDGGDLFHGGTPRKAWVQSSVQSGMQSGMQSKSTALI